MRTTGPAARHYRDRTDAASQCSPGVVHDGVQRAVDALDPAAVILDIGCGRGHNLATIAATRRVVGAEIAFDAAVHASRLAPVVVADAAALPFRPDSFDALICSEVLEHVDSPAAVFADAARILRPGGLMYVTTPNYANVAGLHKLAADWRSGGHDWNPWGAHRGGFEGFMTARRLLRVLRPHLRVDSIRALDYGQAITGRFRSLDRLAWTRVGRAVLHRLIPRLEDPRLPFFPRHGMHIEVIAHRPV